MKTKNDVIIIVGEVLVDIFGEQVVPGGAPFNFARHLAALGMKPIMVTRIGNDASGELLLNEFKRFGMSTIGVQVDPLVGTGRVLVRETAHGHTFEIPAGQAFDRIDVAAALDCLQNVGAPAYFCYGSLIQREAPSRAALRTLRKQSGSPCFVDLNLRPIEDDGFDLAETLQGTSLLKVNETELAELLAWHAGVAASATPVAVSLFTSGECDTEIAALMSAYAIQEMIVTLGAQGYAAFDASGMCTASGSGTRAVKVVDTVGAGDSFAAIVLTGRLLGWPLPLTLSRANAFAASICAVRGAVSADPLFYQRWREQWGMAAVDDAVKTSEYVKIA